MRSFLKWAGCKHSQLTNLKTILPQGKRLIEPFVGSGTVFLNTDYADYILNDTNEDIIHIFQHLNTNTSRIIKQCTALFSPENNTSAQYYALRDAFNQSPPASIERACLFIYLNKHGYNGLCRYNSSGKYNVPFGRYTKPYLAIQEMSFFAEKAKRAAFYGTDFREIFKLSVPGDVIYCDPPYIPLSNTAYFSTYHKTPFSHQDQIDLARLAEEHAKRGVSVVISNHDTPEARDLYAQSDTIHSLSVQRMISCKQRGQVKELIAVYEAL
ncbi:MAG: Dam family site-specific DNA-(adenine-N6)-methyltransferase [Legionellaceae bacterium]|nr:Dam family site-specific DNA-(adenine-N6)-methyltransferase [Legionellaceae bacterium]